jgi:hypothetical protein
LANIQGAAARSANRTATILGTKVSVISCTWVVACNMAITNPTINPTPRSGAESRRVSFMASLAMLTTNSGVICLTSHEKLFTIDPTSRFQPSTSTNNISLKGNETMKGGSIIIPMDRRTLATTMSMIKKGI